MISFNRRLITFLALISLSGIAVAQAQKYEEGLDYRVLPVAQPVEAKGKVEVIEFFWYGCPHCYDFDPDLMSWVKRQPKDVVFRRVPVAFRDDFLPHSQLFYTLQVMGKSNLDIKVMDTIHHSNNHLLTESEIADWAVAQGLDRNTFLTTYHSFAVVSKVRAAKQLAEAYRIDGVPTVVIQGKYVTSPSIAGTKAKALMVMDYLVEKVRKDKYK
ncbi:thiol:disulfide interchange protein DsbA [Polynucleobacter sphagniphilus]|jgi:thiol:disulfide interchange protein DsbA|uniref:Thiol:disulfide interchange protein n=1 Tax=Polynucleobacter sphagniphilus TaxID=1743169 RepID=A0AA43M5X8_9BURK|nr:thiol:disulfide interchange protein DsbA/DsbL [Polynucleobacter sphagniphilus]MDH6155086.1 thiol:disulfide interchange protein DsbA [Polynucleobacter sphagniphilus]MDH6301438.1 thiol:disulfide interchange protein DsbA [Polynucleobacter sphagniphilus]MDH6502791.1 thiol:disulfide interchange protein DsbA [Polynucleobacter sphagniphilus]MDH6511452.1 thiol:disulfide interchange protein DsbA [Polynucleobacter sphagniphilus]